MQKRGCRFGQERFRRSLFQPDVALELGQQGFDRNRDPSRRGGNGHFADKEPGRSGRLCRFAFYFRKGLVGAYGSTKRGAGDPHHEYAYANSHQ